jgi:CRISPR system Cascade subunit CasE
MYLTRIRLNTQKKQTIKLLSSQQVVHATIESCFNEIEKTRKLWRLDYFQGKPCILLLSHTKPELEPFLSQFGYEKEPKEIRDYQKVLDLIANRQQFKFRLTANPVYSVKKEGEKRGQIMPHITIEQQEKWLSEKSEKYGFKIIQDEIVERDRKRFMRNHRAVMFSMVTFEGILEISDEGVFKQTLVDGIGREKAYGCGLLTLARL